jgi:hypothetical protein
MERAEDAEAEEQAEHAKHVKDMRSGLIPPNLIVRDAPARAVSTNGVGCGDRHCLNFPRAPGKKLKYNQKL